jgi:hypothetical protein
MPQDAPENEKKVLAVEFLQRELLPLQTLTIDFHPSIREGALERELAESLQANRIDPKFLYVTPRQAELWRQVFLRHSPIHSNPEFARIYRETFARVAERLQPGKVHLVGLGCGTGLKELDLYSHLKAYDREVLLSAIDVSHDLVVESAQKLAAAGAGHQRSLVCDLAEASFLAEWLDRVSGELSRLMTFFGLVPNLSPSVVKRLFRSLLRTGDILLVSAHLAPVGEGIELPAAMRSVLPQYDNPETMAWLDAGLENAGLKYLLEAPEMTIGEVEGVPAFIATARWKSKISEPLRLFYSLRYTPSLFENLLREEGFSVELLALTSCREEAIWAVTAARPKI